MQQINQILRQVAVEAVTKENIITYLEVVKNNLNLSVLNQAMVYLQRPKAKHVCGKKAWEDIGRKIKPHATPIVLFFPSIKNNDETTSVYSEYIPINTYDLDSTEGDDINTSVEKDIHFVETIIEITGIAPETADIPKTEMVKGLYDTKTNSFYFSNDISLDSEYGRNEYNKAALSIYTDYIFENYKLQDKSLRAAIKYVLFEHYGFTHCIEKPAFRKLDKMSELEKIDFITELQFFTNCITQDFDGYYLNFDETAFINDLLYTSDITEIHKLFDNVIFNVGDKLIRDSLNGLKQKLMRADDEYLNKLLLLRNEQKIYSYPAQKIDLDKTDYLQAERAKLLSEFEGITASEPL